MKDKRVLVVRAFGAVGIAAVPLLLWMYKIQISLELAVIDEIVTALSSGSWWLLATIQKA